MKNKGSLDMIDISRPFSKDILRNYNFSRERQQFSKARLRPITSRSQHRKHKIPALRHAKLPWDGKDIDFVNINSTYCTHLQMILEDIIKENIVMNLVALPMT